jgi:two-component system phosphate regulon sensor histidine kinase PhoR
MASGKWRRQTFAISLAVGLAAAAGGALGHLLPGGTRSDMLITAALSASVAAVVVRLFVRKLRGRLSDAESRYRALQSGVRSVIAEKRELELLLSSMEEAVLLLDDQETIVRTNPAADHTFFAEEGPVAGRTCADVVRHAALQRFVRKASAATRSIDGEVVVDEGGERRFLARGTPVFDEEGERVATLIVLHEVTRLRQLEKVRTDFVANVSHELKTPITAIRGAAETLRDGAAADPDQAPLFLEMIERQSARLQAIVEDLLNLTRLESLDSAEKTRLEIASPAAVVETALELCRPTAQRIGVALEASLDAGARASLNPLLLEQALVNLIDNAVKYSGPGSTVRIAVENGPQAVVIRVSDSGPGIAPEHHSRIFERFYRVDKGRSRAAGGTGLGLSIVKHVVQLHRGHVAIDSAPDNGTTFTIRLPKA